MAATIETSDFIQKVLVENELFFPDYLPRNLKRPWSFYVHASLIEKLGKQLNEMFLNDGWEMYEKILQFGAKWFDMYQIVILRGTIAQLNKLKIFIKSSQCSFPLEENPTLFIEVDSFIVMEEFIADHQLEPFIVKTEEMSGISTKDITIKVVTFNNNVKDVINNFHYKLRFMAKQYFYMTFCFPWERSTKLCKGHIHDAVCSVFPIMLQHLGTINYTTELNIIDLLSLLMAIFDVRGTLQSNFIRAEINVLIKRQLVAKYIENNIFKLHQFLVDQNRDYDLTPVCSYLIYAFQDEFKAVNYNYEELVIFRRGDLADLFYQKFEIDADEKPDLEFYE